MDYVVPVPKLLLDKKFTPRQLKVWRVILQRCMMWGYTTDTDKMLANFAGVSLATFKRTIKQLEELGYVKRGRLQFDKRQRIYKVPKSVLSTIKVELVNYVQAIGAPPTFVVQRLQS